MNGTETQIKWNLSDPEIDVNRQAGRASCWGDWQHALEAWEETI